MKRRSHTLLGLSLGALAWILAACAHGPATAPAAAADQQRQPEMVLVTGSRIPQRVDTSMGLPATTSPTRIYSHQDLAQTGRPAVGDALRQLGP